VGIPGGLEAPTKLDYESESRRFESCRARYSNSYICRNFPSSLAFKIAMQPLLPTKSLTFCFGPTHKNNTHISECFVNASVI
jgi:hypothetical protein